jgi:hypothetical protein
MHLMRNAATKATKTPKRASMAEARDVLKKSGWTGGEDCVDSDEFGDDARGKRSSCFIYIFDAVEGGGKDGGGAGGERARERGGLSN